MNRLKFKHNSAFRYYTKTIFHALLIKIENLETNLSPLFGEAEETLQLISSGKFI